MIIPFFWGAVSWIANRLLGALLSKALAAKCIIRVGCVPSQAK